MRRTTVYEESEPVGKRLGRFFILLGVVFALSAAVIITQRLSTDALALITGGVLVGAPLLAICGLLGFLVLRRETRPARPEYPQGPMPIVLQMPYFQPPTPDYPRALPYGESGGGQREFTIVE